jgi:RNA polymerase sigma factor (sigma-70 family)
MATGQVNRIVHHLRWLAHRGAAGAARAERAQGDGQLLERFVNRQDQVAFEELVRRHGPMVLGVCQRLLGNAHDAEDAFQATFMVLVRRARAVRPRDLVGNWLYGVACRVALSAQARSSRRRAREKQVLDMPHPTTTPDTADDLRPVLDLELSRLPEKYRVPIVLCELEGRSRKDVARQLRVPEGTLSSRLAAGRKLLAARLARRGLLITGTAVSAALASTGQAAVPAILATSTIKAAALGAAGQAAALGLLSARALALTEGVMHAMFISKLKSLAAVLLTIGLFTGGAGLMTLTADEPQPGAAGTGGRKALVLPAGEAPRLDFGVAVADVDKDGWPDIFVVPSNPPRHILIVEGDKELTWDAVARHVQLLEHTQAKKDRLDLEVWDSLLRHVHAHPRYAESCTACHVQQKPAKDTEWRAKAWSERRQVAEGSGGDIIVIRLPKKSSRDDDAQFLRRLFIDVLGRTPTAVETSYFLKDTDPQKYRRIVEQIVRTTEAAQDAQDKKLHNTAREDKQADTASRAEGYVKEKLKKQQLTPEERQLIQKVLEFAAKENTRTQRQEAIDNAIINLFELHRKAAPSTEDRQKR